MQTIHRTTIYSACPHGGTDIDEAEFHTDKLLTCESIQAAIDRLTADSIYQEDLTKMLSEQLGCSVTTRGRHGRFSTECAASPSISKMAEMVTAEIMDDCDQISLIKNGAGMGRMNRRSVEICIDRILGKL